MLSKVFMQNMPFFYRTHNLWNRIPLQIRQIVSPSEFRRELIIHFWELVDEENGSDSIDDSLLQLAPHFFVLVSRHQLYNWPGLISSWDCRLIWEHWVWHLYNLFLFSGKFLFLLYGHCICYIILKRFK